MALISMHLDNRHNTTSNSNPTTTTSKFIRRINSLLTLKYFNNRSRFNYSLSSYFSHHSHISQGGNSSISMFKISLIHIQNHSRIAGEVKMTIRIILTDELT